MPPLPDLRVVDEDGKELRPGQRGELQVRGTTVVRGYWNRPDANAETFVDGWLRTGDVATLDEDDLLYIVDRIKDLVIRGGENIGCGAIEAALLEHPAIVEASVYGVPDERLGEEVGTTLFAPDPPSDEALRTFLATRRDSPASRSRATSALRVSPWREPPRARSSSASCLMRRSPRSRSLEGLGRRRD